MRAGRTCFEILLRAFPGDFRERYGDGMRQAFDDAHAQHRASGRGALLAFLTRTSVDMLASGLRQRLRPRRPSRTRRPRPGAGVSWLDVKLGVRMLGKHPGLTLASVFALAVGIPAGLGPGHFVDAMTAPLPVPGGERILTLRLWSPASGHTEAATFADFHRWRDALTSFQALGAYRQESYDVGGGDGAGPPVRGARVTASTFAVLRVPPEMGRALDPGDEVDGAQDVVVLGHDLWQSRFAGDPGVVGRSVRVGPTLHTVVGVMPEGFLFPVRQQVWLPLRGDPAAPAGAATEVGVFGRLADGVEAERAQRELSTVVARPDPASPAGEERLRAQVAPFAYSVIGGSEGDLWTTPELLWSQALAWLVLLVACVNVGMLIFARTASRAGELTVRTALGASRTRIVSQIFVECLVLAVLAAGLGLALLDVLPRFIPANVSAVLPYWMDFGVGVGTVGRAMGLAVVSAVVAGVVPALRFTGRGVQENIRRADARRTGARFGGLSGALIVADVAIAVAAIGFAVTMADMVRHATTGGGAGIPAEEYLAATLTLPAGLPADGDAADPVKYRARMAATQRELVRRLEAEPGVRSVAVADALPRMEHRSRRVEVEGETSPDGQRGQSVRVARVDLDYFAALGQPILSGRGFGVGDLQGDGDVAIVNTGFVANVLGGQGALRRRIRYLPLGDGAPGPWLEVVGVVGPLGMRMVSPTQDQGVYQLFAPGELGTVQLGIHLGGDPVAFAPRLRALAREVDPTAVVSTRGALSGVFEGDWYLMRAMSWGFGLLVAILLALATSGIYAMMSFAVAERTTEIGIRSALGARRRDVASSIGRRAVGQLAAGVVLGMPLAGMVYGGNADSAVAGAVGAFLFGVAVMAGVGLLACTGPTVRALRITPSQALRGKG